MGWTTGSLKAGRAGDGLYVLPSRPWGWHRRKKLLHTTQQGTQYCSVTSSHTSPTTSPAGFTCSRSMQDDTGERRGVSVGISDTEHTTPEHTTAWLLGRQHTSVYMLLTSSRLCICTHSTPPTQAGTLTDSKHINPGRDRRAEHCQAQACATGVGKNNSSSSTQHSAQLPQKSRTLQAAAQHLKLCLPGKRHSTHTGMRTPTTPSLPGQQACAAAAKRQLHVRAFSDRQTFRSPADARALGGRNPAQHSTAHQQAEVSVVKS